MHLNIHRFLNIVLPLSLCFLYGYSNNSQLQDIETAIIEKDFQKAKTLAEFLIADNPENQELYDVHYYLGLSQLYLKQYQQARETFQALLNRDSPLEKKDRAFLGIIDSFYMAGHYEEALGRAEEMLKTRKDSQFLSLIYLKIARANLRLTRWSEAHEYLTKIIEHYPETLEYYSAKQLLEEKQFFAVQVGSFLNRDRAESLVTELKEQNQYAYTLETTDKDGRKFYRVRIGQLTYLDEAKGLQQKLSHLGYPTLIYP